MSHATLAIRTDHANRNHHLWNNNGTWFIHYTVHPDQFTTRRVRESLKTKDVRVARARRDAILAAFAAGSNTLEVGTEVLG